MIRILILKSEEAPPNPGDILQAEKTKLENLIDAADTTWRTRAGERTEIFRDAKKYNEVSNIWGEIKSVFMQLQANKCAYCEQKLENKNIVHDVEHFRPKSTIKAWLTKTRKEKLKLDFNDQKSKIGYYLLPYNPFNYVSACKQCNSSHKSNCFPIAGDRLFDSEDFQQLTATERPFLPYPLGSLDDTAPEDLISFIGVSPIINPNLTDDHKKLRAFIAIKFFDLDLRESLIKQRSKVIKDIFEAVHTINNDSDQNMVAQKKEDLKSLLSGKEAHTNCARNYFQLCMNDIDQAREHWKLANEYIKNHPDV
jgi:hypothetical protein